MALGNRIAKTISHHCVYLCFIGWKISEWLQRLQGTSFGRHTSSSSVVNIYVGEELWKQVANLTNYSTWTKHRSCSLRIFFLPLCNVQTDVTSFLVSFALREPFALYHYMQEKEKKIEMKAWRELTSLQSSFEGIQGEKIVLFWRFDICGANLIAFIQPCSAREAA